MAADTPAKRHSAMLISLPFRGTALTTLNNNDEKRAAVMFLYSGIPGAAPGGAIKRNYLTLLGVS